MLSPRPSPLSAITAPSPRRNGVTHIAGRLVVFASFILATPTAHAYSGAGGECGDSPLQTAAVRGTPAELQQAIDARVSAQNTQSDGRLGRLSRRLSNATGARRTREDARTVFVRAWTGCLGTTLLDYAVGGQNLPNVRYLLDLGADPNAVSSRDDTLLMRCPFFKRDSAQLHVRSEPPEHSTEETGKVIATYTLLIQRGASLSRYNHDGAGPIHLCNDPAIIDLYIRMGADLSLGLDGKTDAASVNDDPTRRVVDYRVRQIVQGSRSAQPFHFAILERLLPQVSEHHVTAYTERTIASGCKDADRQAACARLARLITVRDPRVFGPGSP